MTAESLLAWRRGLGLTQVDAAAALGCSRRAIQQWEAGIRAAPRYIALAAAAVAAGLKPVQ
jgi:transcriptional regulator with XRE-family HTH domain